MLDESMGRSFLSQGDLRRRWKPAERSHGDMGPRRDMGTGILGAHPHGFPGLQSAETRGSHSFRSMSEMESLAAPVDSVLPDHDRLSLKMLQRAHSPSRLRA